MVQLQTLKHKEYIVISDLIKVWGARKREYLPIWCATDKILYFEPFSWSKYYLLSDRNRLVRLMTEIKQFKFTEDDYVTCEPYDKRRFSEYFCINCFTDSDHIIDVNSLDMRFGRLPENLVLYFTERKITCEVVTVAVNNSSASYYVGATMQTCAWINLIDGKDTLCELTSDLASYLQRLQKVIKIPLGVHRFNLKDKTVFEQLFQLGFGFYNCDIYLNKESDYTIKLQGNSRHMQVVRVDYLDKDLDFVYPKVFDISQVQNYTRGAKKCAGIPINPLTNSLTRVLNNKRKCNHHMYVIADKDTCRNFRELDYRSFLNLTSEKFDINLIHNKEEFAFLQRKHLSAQLLGTDMPRLHVVLV